MKIVQKKSTENCHFYSREKSLYVAWACFRYGFAQLQFLSFVCHTICHTLNRITNAPYLNFVYKSLVLNVFLCENVR